VLFKALSGKAHRLLAKAVARFLSDGINQSLQESHESPALNLTSKPPDIGLSP